MNLPQIYLLLAEIVAVSVVLLGCFRLRPLLGLVPVYAVLGVVFYTAAFLAASVYVELAPGLIVSPGSVALFPAILFTLLAVYITEDAGEARKLIFALVVTDVFVSILGGVTALQLQSSGTLNSYHLSPDLFVANPRISTVSIVALFADTLVIILPLRAHQPYSRLLVVRSSSRPRSPLQRSTRSQSSSRAPRERAALPAVSHLSTDRQAAGRDCLHAAVHGLPALFRQRRVRLFGRGAHARRDVPPSRTGRSTSFSKPRALATR